MEKPISLIKRQFDVQLEKLINESGLPACLIIDTIRYVLVQLENAVDKRYAEDLEAYNKEINDRITKQNEVKEDSEPIRV